MLQWTSNVDINAHWYFWMAKSLHKTWGFYVCVCVLLLFFFLSFCLFFLHKEKKMYLLYRVASSENPPLLNATEPHFTNCPQNKFCIQFSLLVNHAVSMKGFPVTETTGNTCIFILIKKLILIIEEVTKNTLNLYHYVSHGNKLSQNRKYLMNRFMLAYQKTIKHPWEGKSFILISRWSKLWTSLPS